MVTGGLRFGSVCSGIEAASVAWKPLGWEAQWFSEIEPFPSAVLAHHYPEVPNLGDMTRIHENQTFIERPIDLLVGGTPCQSFSVAGLRKGLDDPRGNLALVFLKVLDASRPRWVVWENVPGVLSSNEGRDFGAFIGGLGQLGYGWAYRILDAQYFGVPQRRRRVFVVGHLGDWRSAAAVFFDAHSLSWNPPPRRKAGEAVAGTIRSRSGGGCGPGPDDAAQGNLIAGTVSTKWAKGTGGPAGDECQNLVAHALRADGFDASEDGTGRGTPLVYGAAVHTTGHQGDRIVGDGDVHPALSAQGGNNGGGAGALVHVSEPQSFTVSKNAGGFAWESDVSPTLDASAGKMPNQQYGVRQGMQVRRLTPRECERLQGFPDDYTLISWRGKPASDGPRYKAIGNSMAVPVMNWIGRRIAKVDAIITSAKGSQ